MEDTEDVAAAKVTLELQWLEGDILLVQAAFNEAFEEAKSGGLAAKQVKPMAT